MFACLLGLFALAGAGCSRNPQFAEVEGTVRVNGKPLDKLMVVFVPDAEQGTTGPDSFGFTDESGHYVLTSHTNIPGAVIGKHRVLVRDTILLDEKLMDKLKIPPKSRISLRYDSVGQTPLHAEVKSGSRQTINLEVTGPP
jgi:hypothetical protein